jgi:hypothetical protein
MVICRANSGQIKIDHLKFRVELVQALLVEHGSESVRNFQGHHFTDKNVLTEIHLPKTIPLTEKEARPTMNCIVCYRTIRREDTVFPGPKCAECYRAGTF